MPLLQGRNTRTRTWSYQANTGKYLAEHLRISDSIGDSGCLKIHLSSFLWQPYKVSAVSSVYSLENEDWGATSSKTTSTSVFTSTWKVYWEELLGPFMWLSRKDLPNLHEFQNCKTEGGKRRSVPRACWASMRAWVGSLEHTLKNNRHGVIGL